MLEDGLTTSDTVKHMQHFPMEKKSSENGVMVSASNNQAVYYSAYEEA